MHAEEVRLLVRTLRRSGVDVEYPVVMEALGLVAFPESPSTIWFTFDALSFAPFAQSAVVDTRREECAHSPGTLSRRSGGVRGHDHPQTLLQDAHCHADGLLYGHSFTERSNRRLVAEEVERFHVKAPVAVAPSVILFGLSFTLVVVLVVAEVITRRCGAVLRGMTV